MKKTLWTLSALALIGFCFTACGDDEEVTAESCAKEGKVLGQDNDGNPICVENTNVNTCDKTEATCTDQGLILDAAKCTCVSPNQRKSCKSHDDCEKDQLCGVENECVAASEAANVVRYVRIDDLSTPTDTQEDPGADIDAIVLFKPQSGKTFYAGAVTGQNFPPEFFKAEGKVANDPKKVLGAPDSFTSYTNAGIDESKGCTYKTNGEYTFVSLGGVGGYIEVEMEGAIENGDKLDILELGGCKLNGTENSDGQTAKSENIKLQLSVTKNATSWQVSHTFDRKETKDKGLLSWTVAGL